METKSCRDDLKLYKKRSMALTDALELLSGKWKLSILLHLHHNGKSRFKDLHTYCNGISPKVLSKELQELEMNQLLTRTVNDTRPITVSYALTEHAVKIEPVITALVEFGITHRMEITKVPEQV